MPIPPVVAAGAPGTTDACLAVLRAGGNAIDAAVAAGFAIPMTEPGLGSLGGGGFLTLRQADGSTRVIDFFAAVPRPHPSAPERVTVDFSGTQQDFHVGPATVAVPGVLSGLLHAHRRYGRLPLAEVVAPALRLAREGAVLAPAQGHVLSLIGELLQLTPESAAVFAPGGRLLRAGDLLHNPAYADFLHEVATGAVTRLPAVDPLDAHDLDEYQVLEREPLRVDLGRATLWTNPGPSLGGPIIAFALAELAGRTDPAAITAALADATAWHKTQSPVSVRGTTQVSVAAGGQVVAMTVSNGSGSGVVLGDTGVALNNMMGETDLHPEGSQPVPGARIRSMMAPSVLDVDGRTYALGTGGSERIRSAMTRVVGMLVEGADLADAIGAPRVHLDNQGTVQVEPGFRPEEIEELGARWPISLWNDVDFYFGGVQAVASTGEAAADPRRGGTVGRLASTGSG